jgi:hypothetical protein
MCAVGFYTWRFVGAQAAIVVAVSLSTVSGVDKLLEYSLLKAQPPALGAAAVLALWAVLHVFRGASRCTGQYCVQGRRLVALNC